MKVKSLILGALFIVAGGFSWGNTTALLMEIRDAKSEAQLLQLADQLSDKSIGSAEGLEQSKQLISKRLGEVGTEVSISWLTETAETKPTVLQQVEGQRAPVYEALYPFDVEAKRAIWQIEQREFAADYLVKAADGNWQELVAAAKLDNANSPQVGAWLGVMAQLSEAQSLKAMDALDGSSPATDACGVLLAKLSIQGKQPLDKKSITAMSNGSALFYLRQIKLSDSIDQQLFLESLKAHLGIRSAVVARMGKTEELSLAEFLEQDGADAAFVLAKETSKEQSEELSDLVLNQEVSLSVRRHAVLALMLQKTKTSRDILKSISNNEQCPAELQKKIKSWLGEGGVK